MGVHISLGRERSVAARPVSVALVGRELPGDENLSLRYLAGALSKAGHRPIIVPLGGPHSLPRAAELLERARADIVGLSMPDADITIDALAFVRYLRDRGFRGHITCGGPLATLVRHELLDKHPGIDSVVRHDGELPLTELARRLARGLPYSDIPGISTRDGEGPPARVADPTPLHTRPLHADPLPQLLGVGTARLSASRGCPGRCPYCSPAALQREAVKEARDAGLSRDEWLEAGVGKTRYRHYVDLAEEVADLYHRGGARFFQLVDENVLSGSEERAAGWITGLMKELRRLGVGRTAWCLQADPATLTPKMIDLLEELGAIRVSVGIEGLTMTQLRALGRWGESTDHLEILRTLDRRGIVTSFNSIIVHPQTTVADIERELSALTDVTGIHFDVLSMAVYPGTHAYETLKREGRLTGGMLAARFEPVEAAVSRFRAALIRLRLEGLGRYGANTFAHDVAINVALARRLEMATYEPALERMLASALADMNRARVRSLETALALAQTELSDVERQLAMQALIRSLQRDVGPATQQIARVQHRLQGTTEGPIARSNLMFGSALAAGFFLCLSTAACGGKMEDAGSQNIGGSGTVGTGGTLVGGTGGVTVSTGGTIGTGGTTAGTGGAGGSGGAPASDAGCDINTELGAISDAATVGPRCEPGCDVIYAGTSVPAYESYGVTLDASGRVVDVIDSTGAPVPEPIRTCYMQALSNQTFPCLSGESVWYECYTLLR